MIEYAMNTGAAPAWKTDAVTNRTSKQGKEKKCVKCGAVTRCFYVDTAGSHVPFCNTCQQRRRLAAKYGKTK